MKRILSMCITLWAFMMPLSASLSQAMDEVVLDTDTEYQKLKDHLLKRYSDILTKLTTAEEAHLASLGTAVSNKQIAGSDTLISPWWQASAGKPLADLPRKSEEEVKDLFAKAIRHSSQMKVFSDLPLIRRTTVQEANGEYDTHLFADGHYTETDEPVGDTLKTGGPDRYLEDTKGVSFGLKRKFIPGTEVRIEQQFNRFDNNSDYLDPHRQSQTRTGISLTQPLLKGFGPAYNNAPENLAKVDHESAMKELQRQMAGHLVEVARAYWGLYMERSLFLQKQRLVEKTQEIYNKMQSRVQVDVQPSLLARTKSQILAHQLDADEAKFSILNAQSRLWALVNDPEMVDAKGIELVTGQKPLHSRPNESMQVILETAIRKRPEIDQSMRQIQAAALRHMRSENELFPELNLYLAAYTSGLKGEYDDEAAYRQEWNEGDGSYNVGLRLDFPLLNNSAKARAERKKIELRQLINQLDTTVTNVLLEAQVSYRETIKYHMAMVRRYEVLKSTEEEISDLMNRIDLILSRTDDFGAIQYQLLDAMERLNKAEIEFSASELTYNLALYQLKNAQGSLLEDSRIDLHEAEEDNLPINRIQIGALKLTEGKSDTRQNPVQKDVSSEEIYRQAAMATLDAWKSAWQTCDTAAYLNMYSDDFVPDDKSAYSSWKEKRTKSIARPKYIRIDIDQPVIEVKTDRQIMVSFNQAYESNIHRDHVNKTLILENGSKGWKIFREHVNNVL